MVEASGDGVYGACVRASKPEHLRQTLRKRGRPTRLGHALVVRQRSQTSLELAPLLKAVALEIGLCMQRPVNFWPRGGGCVDAQGHVRGHVRGHA